MSGVLGGTLEQSPEGNGCSRPRSVFCPLLPFRSPNSHSPLFSHALPAGPGVEQQIGWRRSRGSELLVIVGNTLELAPFVVFREVCTLLCPFRRKKNIELPSLGKASGHSTAMLFNPCPIVLCKVGVCQVGKFIHFARAVKDRVSRPIFCNEYYVRNYKYERTS